MSDASELFQAFAALPNLPKEELKKDVRQRVLSGLDTLNALFPDARRDYQRDLAARAQHHSNCAREFFLAQSGVVAIEASGRTGQLLRDFYHHAYYALFYIARYSLVSIGSYDCSEHALIEAVLMEEVRRFARDKEEEAARLVAEMETWRKSRNVADYIISKRRLEALASYQQVQGVMASLDAHLSVWSVP